MPTEKSNGSQAAKPPTKPKKVRGEVYVNTARCKGCGFCIEFCPQHVLEFSEEFNPHGYHPPRLIDPDGCTGCDLCGLYCPDFAIYAVMKKTGTQPAAPPESSSHAPSAPQAGEEK